MTSQYKTDGITSYCVLCEQCVGATLGAAILYGVTPAELRGTLGSNAVGNMINGTQPAAGLVMELIGTAILVLVVYATAVDNNNKEQII